MKGKERMLDKNNMTLSLEKMEKKSICKNQISRNELSKKKSLQERGITLIALVVTIIILLILAGVTLNMALSDNGLFSKTQEAADKYKQAQEDEELEIEKIEYAADGRDIKEVKTISNEEGFEEFREKVNSGDNFENTLVKLSSDLDLGGETWEPIGTASKPFNGVFNGNGHTINNLKLENASDSYKDDTGGDWKWIGLFGYNKGIIKNLGIVGATITENLDEKSSVGLIVGNNVGKIERCYNKANIECRVGGGLGGIAGRLESGGQIIECYNEGEFNITPIGKWGSACGIAGTVTDGSNGKGSIKKCYNKGNITCNQIYGNNYIASGICSMGSITIESNYNVGEIRLKTTEGEKHRYPVASGIVGQASSNSSLLNNYNVGAIIVETNDCLETVRKGSICGLIVQDMTIGDNFGFCSDGLEVIGPKVTEAVSVDISKAIKYQKRDDMKSIAELLGPDFKEDPKNINDGFPILTWQDE